jgi:hypothetical protein
MSDLSCVFYTANTVPHKFAQNTLKQLQKASEGLPFIRVDKDPMAPPNHFNIYRQALYGAKQAKTRYIACVEDDVLYSPEHFKHRPKKPFAYNMNFWNIHTWGEPMFTQKSGGRRNLGQLICDREAFIEAMEERFKKHPNPSGDLKEIWAEPSKYERQLGVTVREWEPFYTNPPNIMFSHQTSLSYKGLGERKRLGEIRALEVPYWGNAKTIRVMYE